MKIGFLQFNPEFGKVDKNLHKIERLLKEVEADIIVLPELATTGYLFLNKGEVEELAEEIPNGKTILFLMDLSKRLNSAITFGIAEKTKEGIYNSAVTVFPEGNFEFYRKTHLFFEEKLFFIPGNTGFKTFNFRGATFGVMICFDWFFPESARILALMGAQVILHPANLVLPWCQKAMITRAIENRIFAVTANRTGKEERGNKTLIYTGKSQIVNPEGEVICSAGEDEEVIKIVEITPEEALDKRLNEYNGIWKDRRPEFYDTLCIRESQE